MRERRRPRQPNEIGPHLEQPIVAFSLAHPGFGPRRVSAELAREKWDGIRISEHGIRRVLCRVGLNTRLKRLALIARHLNPYERAPTPPPPERHIDASQPGELGPPASGGIIATTRPSAEWAPRLLRGLCRPRGTGQGIRRARDGHTKV